MRDLTILYNYGRDVLKNLLFIVYFEFDMGSVNYEEKDGRYYIDEIYDKYCKQYGLDPEEHTKTIEDLKSVYKIKLNFFDEYPTLEEPFETMMGPKITLDIVKKVITGEMSDQQAYEILRDGSDDDDDIPSQTTLAQTTSDGTLTGMKLF